MVAGQLTGISLFAARNQTNTVSSQLCSRLASSGLVVLAIQHCDGSGHAFISSTTGLRLYIKEKDLMSVFSFEPIFLES